MTMPNEPAPKKKLLDLYNRIVGGVEGQATDEELRAYGGVVRSVKGKLVEDMAQDIIRLAWKEAGGDAERLSIGNQKTYQIKIQRNYIKRLPSEVKAYVKALKPRQMYRAQVDNHIFVDNKFMLGIECKTYTENAMLKRILVDFQLLKSLHPELICCLLQLESMLGGTLSKPLLIPQLGSPSSHTIMSYFPTVDLKIITLLEGERDVNRPIHKKEFFKELHPEHLDNAINQFSVLLKPLI